MSAVTGISWTDSTFNPWIGCTKVSPACDHCYAERDMALRHKRVEWGAGKPRSRTSVGNWKLPERWNRVGFLQCTICDWRGDVNHGAACPNCCHSVAPACRRVFCSSLADVFDNEVPIEWLVDLLDLIRRTPNLDWLLLTKRIGNFKNRLQEATTACWSSNPALRDWLLEWWGAAHQKPPANVWIGSTVVNQQEADRDIPKLLAVPARVRFLSMEPLLGPIDLRHIVWGSNPDGTFMLNWVIVGGESGPNARPMHPDWVRSLRDQCQQAGVAFHFKQWGEWAPSRAMSETPSGAATHSFDSGKRIDTFGGPLRVVTTVTRFGKKAAGRLLDGRTWDEFPQSTAAL